MNLGQRLGLAALLLMLAVGGCGSDDAFVAPGGGGGGGGGPGDPSAPTVSSLLLLVDPPVLSSDAIEDADGVRVTAIARDASNVVMPNVTIDFSADSGALAVTDAVTDASGRASAVLTTGGDARNRTITVSAAAGGVSQSITIDVSGTQLLVDGPASIESGVTETFTVSLADAGGNGLRDVTVNATSAQGNLITPAAAVTNPTGVVTFDIEGTTGGTDTITFTALDITTTVSVLVSNFGLSFAAPAAATEVDLGSPTVIEVDLVENGTPLANEVIQFSATRGTLSALSATTDASGRASVTLNSATADGAGPVLVTAIGPDDVTRKLQFEFVATNPTTINLQADPATIAPSTTSSLLAVVRDPDGNPVKNMTVRFSLDDISGGQLTASTAVTDSQGVARTSYRASSASSAQQGVRVTAEFGDPAVASASANLTVAAPAVFITLGTDNRIVKVDESATYEKTYSAIVVDSAGNPAPAGTVLSLTLRSLEYQKGVATLPAPPSTADWNFTGTIDDTDPFYGTPNPSAPPAFGPYFGFGPFGCRTEDPLGTGDVNLANDYNNNGQVDPANVAVVPGTVTLDGNGVASFVVRWPQSYAMWVMARLTARTTVAGTESSRRLDFVLTMAAADADRDQVPPNQFSPFGAAANCTDPT